MNQNYIFDEQTGTLTPTSQVKGRVGSSVPSFFTGTGAFAESLKYALLGSFLLTISLLGGVSWKISSNLALFVWFTQIGCMLAVWLWQETWETVTNFDDIKIFWHLQIGISCAFAFLVVWDGIIVILTKGTVLGCGAVFVSAPIFQ